VIVSNDKTVDSAKNWDGNMVAICRTLATGPNDESIKQRSRVKWVSCTFNLEKYVSILT
jgi:hypothetical protein